MNDIRGYFGQTWPTNQGWKADCPACGNTDRTFNWSEEKQVGCCFHESCRWYYQSGGATLGRLAAFFKGFEYKVPELIVEADEADVKLPEAFTLIDDLGKSRETLYAYLSYRGIPKQIVKRARLGYCETGEHWGYIVMPVFEDGEVVYWQGRRFKNREPKFYNPKSTKKSDLIYSISQTRRPKVAVVVESVINALTLESPGRCSTVIEALLGKTMSERQCDKILYHEKSLQKVIVALDGDARREAVQIASVLAARKAAPLIEIAFFADKDINELGREKSWSIIRKAEQYDSRRRTELMVKTV